MFSWDSSLFFTFEGLKNSSDQIWMKTFISFSNLKNLLIFPFLQT